MLSDEAYKFNKFKKNFFQKDTVNLSKLRQAAWNGVPYQYRAVTWMIMLGYMPVNRNRRKQCLKRRREDYARFVEKYFDAPEGERSAHEQETLRQVLVDVPRTQPDSPLFAQKPIRRMLERILYVWALRRTYCRTLVLFITFPLSHRPYVADPASGYVQGINDVACPFILVFLDHYLRVSSSCSLETMELSRDLEFDGKTRAHVSAATCDVGAVSSDILRVVEADVYWCLDRFLNCVQNNFTPGQPGVQRSLFLLKGVIRRDNPSLSKHFESQNVLFEQFAFRWINCFLLRELTLSLATRLFDTFIAEGDEFGIFNVYVSGALLQTWSKSLQKMEFQDMLTFLQALPTKRWKENDVTELLAKAFQLKCLYDSSRSHLVGE